ncbi:MAG: hypothetical protein ACTSP4_16780 [Candidatus Hodarchaeales archaeon]
MKESVLIDGFSLLSIVLAVGFLFIAGGGFVDDSILIELRLYDNNLIGDKTICNLTSIDLHDYPTLALAIETLIDPENEKDAIRLSIQEDESSQIKIFLGNLGSTAQECNLFAYNEHVFSIGFIA